MPPIATSKQTPIISTISKDHTVDYVFATTLLFPDRYDSRVALRTPGPSMGRFLDW